MQLQSRPGKYLIAVQILFVLFSLTTKAQSSFVSADDQELSIKSVTVVPFTDNVKGIYAAPMTTAFMDLLSNDSQWSYQPLPQAPTTETTLDLDENPAQVTALAAAAKVDALLTFRLTKGPHGMNGTLTLYTAKSGLPLLQEELRDYTGFEIKDLEKQVADMYTHLKSRLPYMGVVLSRRGQELTINLGYKTGIKAGDELSVVQILKINRHPKLHILVSTEKEILGKIKVYKADELLSFAYVTFEKEPGVVQAGSKLLPKNFVQYNEPVVQDGKIIPGLENRKDRDVSYGNNAREWLPENAPQYGRIAVLAGIGNYSQSVNLQSQSLDSSTTQAPIIAVRGEIWISPEWNILYNLSQSVFSVPNPLSGSTPGHLNMSLSSYGVLGAYNFLMSNDFFGPKLQLSAGYATFNSRADQSTPLTYTDMNYGGLIVGLSGQFPISTDVPIDLGARFNLFVDPNMSESISSGSSSRSTINEFSFFGIYHLRSRFKIRAEINFQYYSSDFSGNGSGDRATDPASNSTQKMTSFLGGIEYLF